MRRFKNQTKPFERQTAVMLGNFDGFHRAHQALARQTVALANERGLLPVAFSFLDPPDKGLQLTTNDQKEAFLKKMGIKALFSYDFQMLCDLDAAEFTEKILLSALQAKLVVCGFNYRFAKGRSADVEDLRALLSDRAELFVLPALTDEGGEVISSSKIRTLFENGDTERAEALLGHALPDCYTR